MTKKRVNFLELLEFTDGVIQTFKESPAYAEALAMESFEYLQRGSAHMVRQLHNFFNDKQPLVAAYDLFFASKEARLNANFVPFSDWELEEIHKLDAEKGDEVWTLPPISNL